MLHLLFQFCLEIIDLVHYVFQNKCFFLVIDKGPSPILKPLERGKTETAQFSSEKNPDCSVIARLVHPIHPQHVVLWLLVLI